MRNLHTKEPCRDQPCSYFVSSPLDNLSSYDVTIKCDFAGSGTFGRLLMTHSSSAHGKSVHTGKFSASIGYKNHAKTE
jgi:hypothetical protein